MNIVPTGADTAKAWRKVQHARTAHREAVNTLWQIIPGAALGSGMHAAALHRVNETFADELAARNAYNALKAEAQA